MRHAWNAFKANGHWLVHGACWFMIDSESVSIAWHNFVFSIVLIATLFPFSREFKIDTMFNAPHINISLFDMHLPHILHVQVSTRDHVGCRTHGHGASTICQTVS